MKFLLVDDHALFREGLRYVLHQLPETSEIMEAGSFPDGLLIAEQHPELDLALLDLNMPGSEGAISIRYFHQRYPHIPVMVVSSEEDRCIMERVMDYGAMGYVCKNSSAQVMLGAVGLVLSGGLYIPQQVMRGGLSIARSEVRQHHDRRRLHTNEYGLTSRQMDVLGHLAAGLSNKQIAAVMNLAEGTIKIHVAAVYQNLRVSNRMEAVRVAEKLGLVGAANE